MKKKNVQNKQEQPKKARWVPDNTCRSSTLYSYVDYFSYKIFEDPFFTLFVLLILVLSWHENLSL